MSRAPSRAVVVPRIGIDVSAIPIRAAGAGRYVIELVRALDGRDDVTLDLFARRGDRARWVGIAPSARVRAVTPDARVGRVLFGAVALGQYARHLDPPIDLFFGPHYSYPLGTAGPVAVTIHDLTLVEHPEWHERTKTTFFARAIERAARHAEAISLPAPRDAERFVERYAPRGEVAAVAHGVDHDRFTPDEPSPGHDRATLDRLGITDRYALMVGTIEPRKNHPIAVAAFDSLAQRDGEIRFVIAGQDGWGTEPLDRAIAAARSADRIDRIGYVADDDLPALLRNAACVLYPSSAEGFGLPALEALACGTALITTPDTPMADVAGPSAILVAAGDVDALTDALVVAVVDQSGSDSRRVTGIATAATYTWEASADAHVALWKRGIERAAQNS